MDSADAWASIGVFKILLSGIPYTINFYSLSLNSLRIVFFFRKNIVEIMDIVEDEVQIRSSVTGRIRKVTTVNTLLSKPTFWHLNFWTILQQTPQTPSDLTFDTWKNFMNTVKIFVFIKKIRIEFYYSLTSKLLFGHF